MAFVKVMKKLLGGLARSGLRSSLPNPRRPELPRDWPIDARGKVLTIRKAVHRKRVRSAGFSFLLEDIRRSDAGIMAEL
jgi:hypothetical protein